MWITADAYGHTVDCAMAMQTASDATHWYADRRQRAQEGRFQFSLS